MEDTKGKGGDNVSEITSSSTNNSRLHVSESSKPRKAKDIKPIDTSIVHRICSGQVIVSLSNAVKELVENSIDAGATSVEIRLTEQGSKLIEVIDNGNGITESNFESFALKHHTSKLKEFDDLNFIATFGFRGEAINSLCGLSKLSVVTKSVDSKLGCRLQFDSHGKLASRTPSSRQCGTTVVLENLFSPIPVRRKEFLKNLKREYNKMITVLYGYALLHPNIRITCTNKNSESSQIKVLNLPAHQDLLGRVASIFGSKQIQSLVPIEQLDSLDESTLAEYNLTDKILTESITLEGLISRPNQGRNSTDRQFIFVNFRPCEHNKISRLVNEIYHNYGSRNQSPFVCLHIKTKQENIDVNVTPDKRSLFMQDEKIVLAILKATLQSVLSSASSSFDSSQPLQDQFSNSQSSIASNYSDTSSEQSPSSSCQEKSSSRTSFRVPRSQDLKPFSPQVSGNSQKKSIRSIFQRFARNSNASGDSQCDDEEKSFSSPKTTEKVLQPYKRPREVSTQPKLEEFWKKRLKKVRVVSDFVPKENDDDIINISDDSDDNESQAKAKDGISYFPITKKETSQSTATGSDSGEDIHSSSEEDLTIVQDAIDITQAEVTVSKKISQDSCFFSQDTNEDGAGILDCEDDNSNTVVVYDDDPEYYEDIVYDGTFNSVCPKNVNIHLDWALVKKRLRNKWEKTDTKCKEATVRRFRANILSDNKTVEEELRKELTKDKFSEMEVIGQFNKGFIIAKHGSDLFIIDQHAADEKYNFETLQQDTVLQSQRLISPLLLQLPAISENILMDNIQIFQKNGFEFDINLTATPTSRVSLTRIPYSKNCEFGKEDVEELIYMLEDAPEKCFCRPSKVRRMFASRACKKSVTIGNELSPNTMYDIVRHLGELEQPWNCPHGRPTLRHLFNLNLLPDFNNLFHH